MTVKISKQAQVQVPKKDLLKTSVKYTLSKEVREKVDTLARLQVMIDGLKPVMKEAEALKKDLRAVADEMFPAQEEAVLTGFEGHVTFSPAGETRFISDMHGMIGILKEKVGYEGLLPLLNIPMSAIDAYLSTKEAEPFLGKKPSSRMLK